MHWRDLAEHVRRTVGQVDALIVDAPYSERTHAGHDSGVDSGQDTYNGKPSKSTPALGRRSLAYGHWTESDVGDFVSTWSPIARGWIVSLTDHALALPWIDTMESVGRYSFAPIACVESGSRVRLVGDGPPTWATWLCVSRPRSVEWARWATIENRAARGVDAMPGAYVVPPGHHDRKDVVGGKSLWLMERLVEDYTRPGDLVCDPCMGAGTTLLAAKLLGRRYIGGDLDEKHVEIARERLRDMPAAPKKGTLALPWEK